MLRALLAAALLWLPAAAGAQTVRLLTTDDAREAIEYVCSVVDRDCSSLEPPLVVYTNTCVYFGACIWGGFLGEQNPGAIYLDTSLLIETPERMYQTFVHEVTHYVDWHLGITGMSRDTCPAEELAFHVANLWSLENGVEPRWSWRQNYASC